MKLAGARDLPRPPGAVFAGLLDAALLRRCIPGCESLEEVAPRRYQTVVKAGVGPVKGTFRGTVELSDVVDGEGYRMSVRGRSPVGHAQGSAAVRLEEVPGGTRLHYEGEAKVSGTIASLGGRLLDTAGRKLAARFFDDLARELAAAE